METVLMKESPELEEKLGAWIILTFYVYIFSSFVLGGLCQKRVQFIIFAFPRKPITTNQTWRGLLRLEV
jgi:hypothetical protein